MTPALQKALDSIEAMRRHVIRSTELSDSPYEAANLPRWLNDLDRQAEVYRFIEDFYAVTDRAERLRLLDALYVYTRQDVWQEQGLVLHSGEELPDDPFDIARFRYFSVPQWWASATGERPTLCDLTPTLEPVYSEGFNIGDGTFVYRSEDVSDGTRWQSFGPRGPHANWYLATVIRQWVEEPDTNLEVALKRNPEWQKLVNDPQGGSASGRGVKDLLKGVGLPYTPSIQSYFIQQHEARFFPKPNFSQPVVPRRGGMATTFVFATDDGDQTRLEQISAATYGWATGDFWRLVGGCFERHADWVQRSDFGMPNVARSIGRDSEDDAINRDIAAGLSDKEVVSAHLAREEANYNKKGLPFTTGAKNRERRKAAQRFRDKKKKKIDLFGAGKYCPNFLPRTIPSERGLAPTNVFGGNFYDVGFAKRSSKNRADPKRHDAVHFGIPVRFAISGARYGGLIGHFTPGV